MVAKALNTLGLMLNIFGVIILFFFSFPQPSHQAYVGIAVESGTVLSDGRTAADHANDARLTRERYVFYSGCGMMLIIVGFVFQLIGTWSDEKSEWL